MQEKRKDLKNTKQRAIIQSMMTTLSKSHPSFYYLATTDMAAQIKNYIDKPGNLSRDDQQVVEKLTHRDIQILLSLH